MSELTYKQAAVLCRVEGMPMQMASIGADSKFVWLDITPGPSHNSVFLKRERDVAYRLTPGAPLTPDQAAICLAMGVEVMRGIGLATSIGACTRIRSLMQMCYGDQVVYYVLPPAKGESE